MDQQYLPREVLEDNSSRNTVLRYSYEDLFITKVGYGFTLNSQGRSGSQSLYNTNGYQLRVGSELAGTLPYVITRFHDFGRNGSGERLLGNVPYAQYFKFDIDYAKSVRLTEQSSLAFHAAFGVAVPYGNSTMIPYEKRYFSGGANSVRGWSVRELGPGTFVGKDGKVDFINQTGNLRLDLSVEYRARLFWKLHGAVFVDAGNIWNTRQYEGQDGEVLLELLLPADSRGLRSRHPPQLRLFHTPLRRRHEGRQSRRTPRQAPPPPPAPQLLPRLHLPLRRGLTLLSPTV